MNIALYQHLTAFSGPLLNALLHFRLKRGKEDLDRLSERKGVPALPRPDGSLVWIHAASVGEAQSALIIMDRIGTGRPVLITSGTVTSARFLSDRLPRNAFHQFIPLDHPKWVAAFLDHWQPEAALWMESELWPNMLLAMKKRGIPVALVNARMSERSFKIWQKTPKIIAELLQCFSLILTQSKEATEKYKILGAPNIHYTDNIKYSAVPLSYNSESLERLQNAIGTRPVWLYASTHDGEEQLAADIHNALKKDFPSLLTIIAPRHPARRVEIHQVLKQLRFSEIYRGEKHSLPHEKTEIYVADTLGEMGLFYRLCSIAMIGRSFSNDGGGGHNPIEAAQLDCAILSGPNIQYQKEIFEEMSADGAAIIVKTQTELLEKIRALLSDSDFLLKQKNAARDFSQKKHKVVDEVMSYLGPLLDANKKTD